MPKTSKSDRIRAILHLSNAKIAKRIGCMVEYVRAVRQRTDSAGNPMVDPANAEWFRRNRLHHNAACLARYHRLKAAETRP